MKKVFHQLASFDKKCYDNLALSPDILMENASNAIGDYIYKHFDKNLSILIVCGYGNNGADGITLSRQINGDYKVSLYLLDKNVSGISKIQLDRAKKVGVNIVDEIVDSDIIVDCIFGSGLSREISDDIENLILKLNNFNGYKIACDIPSGLYPQNILNKHKQKIIFKTDTVITMGSLKTSMFSDIAKDTYKKIKIANLGISQQKYQGETNIYLLDKKDLILPFRDKQNTHKGIFGHSVVITGDNKNSKIGAGILALKSSMVMGSGLATLVAKEINIDEYEIMVSENIPYNTTAIAMGMGLGDISDMQLDNIRDIIVENTISCIIDADLFYHKKLLEFLELENIVLTPHPKEFISLLKITKIADIHIDDLVNNRFYYLQKFIDKYPNITCLLKGANTLIASKGNIYIQKFGSSTLSKGGMGDVLAGVILAYLAQGYSLRDSTIYGSLAHSLASKKYKKNNYSLTPKKLIKLLARL
jgi:hydroxyethylthiazole kinase-like uncharacterized protein yjeF